MSDGEKLRRNDGEADAANAWPEAVERLRARTPARLLTGRAGAAYRTATQLELREAHAAARDAVRSEFALLSAFGAEFIERWRLFEVRTRARSKDEYLLRPDLGRSFDEATREEIRGKCTAGADVQVVIGDGLSVSAVTAQVPGLLPLLAEGTAVRGWRMGRVFAVRYCRVGVLNEIGEVLAPGVVVLLIGERPGLATAESLSAYLAYRPKAGDTDAERNLVSNIHARGLGAGEAAGMILGMIEEMRRVGRSGSAMGRWRRSDECEGF